MSRVYARLEDGDDRVLFRIECDAPGCKASIKPHPEIATSGWTKQGWRYGPDPRSINVHDYCPEHSS